MLPDEREFRELRSAWQSGNPKNPFEPVTRHVFLHVPKTAGSSLGALLRSRFDPSECLGIESITRVPRRWPSDASDLRFLQSHAR